MNSRDDSDSEVQVLLACEEKKEWESEDEPPENTGLIGCALKNVEEQSNRASLTSKNKFIVLRVYKRRWFILGIFSLLSFMQVRKQLVC